jgi:hypothetical protein
MAQSTAVIRASLTAGPTTSTTDFTKASFGTPTGAIIIACRANATNNPQTEAGLSIGFWDGTNQCVVANHLDSGVANSNTAKSSNDGAAVIIGDAGVIQATFTVSNITDGIRLTMGTDATGDQFFCTVILFAGVSVSVGTITPNATQDATTASASLGFAPKLVLFGSIGDPDADNSRVTGSSIAWGLAEIGGTHRSVRHTALDAQGAETCSQIYSETRAISNTWGVEVTTWGADTFTITTRDAANASAHLCFYMALGGADLSYEVETFDTRTTTGDTILGTSVTPESVLFCFTNNTAAGSVATDSDANGFSIGLADDNGQFSHNFWVEDAADPTSNGATAQAAAAIDLDSSSAGSRTDLCSGTVTLNAADVTLTYTTVDASARKSFGIVFGPAVASGHQRRPGLLLLGCGA